MANDALQATQDLNNQAILDSDTPVSSTPSATEAGQEDVQIAENRKETEILEKTVGEKGEETIANAAGGSESGIAASAAAKILQNPNDKDAQKDFVNAIETNIGQMHDDLHPQAKGALANESETPEFQDAIKTMGGEKLLKEVDGMIKDKAAPEFSKVFDKELLKGLENLKGLVSGGTEITATPSSAAATPGQVAPQKDVNINR